ncbi:Poly(hydroxyalcanoate) granule associated protein (phasin) [compost metagenome]
MAGKKNSEKESSSWVGGIEKYSRKIWLAGLGIYSKIDQDGNKLFESLVKDGEKAEKQAKSSVDAAKASAKSATSRVGDVKDRALGKWSELEEAFDKRLNSAISRLGVPSRNEVKALHQQVDTLTKQIEKLTGASVKPASSKPAAAKAAAKPLAKAAPKAAAKPAAKPAAAKTAAAKPAAKAAANQACSSEETRGEKSSGQACCQTSSPGGQCGPGTQRCTCGNCSTDRASTIGVGKPDQPVLIQALSRGKPAPTVVIGGGGLAPRCISAIQIPQGDLLGRMPRPGLQMRRHQHHHLIHHHPDFSFTGQHALVVE